MISTVVAPGPVHSPPSNTRSMRPSIAANRSIPLVQVGSPEMFALVAMSAWPTRSMIALASFDRTCRRPEPARVPGHFQRNLCRGGHDHGQRARPEVARQNVEPARQIFRQVLGHQNIVDQKRQRADALPPLCLEHSHHRLQIQRIRHQSVKRVGRYPDHSTSGNSEGGPIDHFGAGIVGIEFNEVCCHVLIIAAVDAGGKISSNKTIVLRLALSGMPQSDSLAFADCLGNLERHLVTAKRRAQLHAATMDAPAPPSRAQWQCLRRGRSPRCRHAACAPYIPRARARAVRSP